MAEPKITSAGRTRRWLHAVGSALYIVPPTVGIVLIAGFLILPTLLVAGMSLTPESYIHFPPSALSGRWYAEYFNDPSWIRATLLSFRVAFGTMLLATVVGTMAALAFVRGALPGTEIIRALSLTPLVTPSIVTAVAIYLAFAPIGLTDNYFGFLIAHTILALPYVILVLTASLAGIDSDIELAAMNCGASRFRAFVEVALPNILPGVIAAAVFAFLTSFDEATVAIFIAGAGQQTLTSKLFSDINNYLTPVIPAVATMMVVLSLSLMGAIAAVRRVLNR